VEDDRRAGNERARRSFESPIGRLAVVCDASAVRGVRFHASDRDRGGPAAAEELCRRARGELEAYLAGELREFTVPVAPAGTPFHRDVWDAMCEIPYGETLSYGEIARRVGQPDAGRAVGVACGANPIPLVIPCHRVLAAGGAIGGFGGGVDVKRWLLGLEQGQLLL
jgi:methylated-DNA-[protein]-cysteine S-methyltransferase